MHGFSCNLKKHTLVSFSKTSNCTRPSARAISLVFEKLTRADVFSKLHSKTYYYLYKQY